MGGPDPPVGGPGPPGPPTGYGPGRVTGRAMGRMTGRVTGRAMGRMTGRVTGRAMGRMTSCVTCGHKLYLLKTHIKMLKLPLYMYGRVKDCSSVAIQYVNCWFTAQKQAAGMLRRLFLLRHGGLRHRHHHDPTGMRRSHLYNPKLVI